MCIKTYCGSFPVNFHYLEGRGMAKKFQLHVQKLFRCEATQRTHRFASNMSLTFEIK